MPRGEIMKKWHDLAKLIQVEPSILGERNSPETLKGLVDKKLAFTREVDGDIVAYAGMFPTSHKDWLEFGSMFVRKDHRGKGMLSELFPKCMGVIHNGFRVLVVTYNPKVIHLCIKAKLNESPCTKAMDPPTEVVCGPCDRVPDNEKHICPFRYKRNRCAVFFL